MSGMIGDPCDGGREGGRCLGHQPAPDEPYDVGSSKGRHGRGGASPTPKSSTAPPSRPWERWAIVVRSPDRAPCELPDMNGGADGVHRRHGAGAKGRASVERGEIGVRGLLPRCDGRAHDPRERRPAVRLGLEGIMERIVPPEGVPPRGGERVNARARVSLRAEPRAGRGQRLASLSGRSRASTSPRGRGPGKARST